MTLTQTIEIPENRWIRVPQEVPTGSVILTFKPVEKQPRMKKSDLDALIGEIQAICKDAPISTETFREERRRDLELEQQKNIRLCGERI
jgi:hypothetical protein